MTDLNDDKRSAPGMDRRDLLRNGALGAAALGLSRPTQLALPGVPGSEDYRALVCVFLFGGADSVNFVVPRSGAAYQAYSTTRGMLAEPLNSLLPITPRTSDGNQYGLHGRMPELQQRFGSGELAIVANVGPLAAPTTKQQFLQRSVTLPPFLFSHSDQQVQWQLADADGLGRNGWAGRLADRIDRLNQGTQSRLPMNVSLVGPVPMLVGDSVQPFSLGPEGTESLGFLDPVDDPSRRRAFDRLFRNRTHPLAREFARVQGEAIAVDAELRAGFASAPTFTGLFPQQGELGAQLRAVARTISLRRTLGVKRQIFFVGLGGFDTHDDQLNQLPGLFTELSQALDGFQRALEQLGEQNRVTTFTASDFGRTLSSNGRGSDHGWGGHSLVLGAAVRGGDIYGQMPDLTLGGPDDIGEGRLLPTIAVDQYAATLSKWMGLSSTELRQVFPNLGRFATEDLGFMA